MTHEPAGETDAAARSTNRVGADGTPLRGAPLHSAAPRPTAEAVTAATESAASLRAGLMAPQPERGLARLVSAVRRVVGGR